jgi:hypothetical protein
MDDEQDGEHANLYGEPRGGRPRAPSTEGGLRCKAEQPCGAGCYGPASSGLLANSARHMASSSGNSS